MLGFDDHEDFGDSIDVHVEVVFVFVIEFEEQLCSFDSNVFGVSFDVFDEDFFFCFVVLEDFFVEEDSGVGYQAFVVGDGSVFLFEL